MNETEFYKGIVKIELALQRDFDQDFKTETLWPDFQKSDPAVWLKACEHLARTTKSLSALTLYDFQKAHRDAIGASITMDDIRRDAEERQRLREIEKVEAAKGRSGQELLEESAAKGNKFAQDILNKQRRREEKDEDEDDDSRD